MKKFQIFLIIFLLSLPSTALPQTNQRTITLFSEMPPSHSLSVYVRVLTAGLVEAGFEVADNDGAPFPVWPSQIRAALQETDGALGLAYLETQLSEGDKAAALLSTPGAFTNLNEQRVALQGVIGDAARDEINDDNLLALRLWPHSTDALVSRTQLASIEDIHGLRIDTRDPYSVAFFKNLGAVPMHTAFDEVPVRLTAGATNVAIVPQDIFQRDNILDLITDGTIIPEYKIWTGVTLTSPDWWRSLTAGEQRRLLAALETAEGAVANSVQEATNQAIGQSLDGTQVVSWQDFDAAEIRRAVSASISENTQVDTEDAEGIMQLRDDIEELQQQPDQGTDMNEPEQNGSLNQPVKVFFASNRRFDPDEKLLVDRFANTEDYENELRCGELTLPDADQVGRMSGEVTLVMETTITTGRNNCIKRISSAVQKTGGKVLIQIHGYQNTFHDAVRTGLAFSRDAESEGVVVIWSWPSAGALRSYIGDGEAVSISEPVFNEFSNSLSGDTGVDHFDFLAHSMGSRLVANLMRDEWIDQPSAVVLAAADVSRPYLKEAVQAVQAASITLLASERDRALVASRTIHGRPRAGLANPLFLMTGVDTIDLTAFDRLWSTNHRHMFAEREVIADLAKLFKGKWTAISRGLQPFPSDGSHIKHYRICPDDRSTDACCGGRALGCI